jgi:hypothetical protein
MTEKGMILSLKARRSYGYPQNQKHAKSVKHEKGKLQLQCPNPDA